MEPARIDPGLDPQPVAETRALDLEIGGRHLELVGERDELLLRAAEDVAEDVGEPLDARLGLVRIGADQLRDGVEAVEEEVRVHLRPQRGELRGGRELGQLALAVLQREDAVPVLVVADQRDHDGRHDRQERVEPDRHLPHLGRERDDLVGAVRHAEHVWRTEEDDDHGRRRERERREDDAGDEHLERDLRPEPPTAEAGEDPAPQQVGERGEDERRADEREEREPRAPEKDVQQPRLEPDGSARPEDEQRHAARRHRVGDRWHGGILTQPRPPRPQWRESTR